MRRQSRSDSNNEQRISDIIQRLSTLAIETQELTEELQTITERTPHRSERTPIQHNNDHTFQIGDRVVIKNKYLGHQGTYGTIISVTKKQVTLQSQNGTVHTRSYKNINYEQPGTNTNG